MAYGSKVSLHLDKKSIPVIESSIEYLRNGFIPEGTYSNKNTYPIMFIANVKSGSRIYYLNHKRLEDYCFLLKKMIWKGLRKIWRVDTFFTK